MCEYQKQAESFVWDLLGDPKRRITIMMHWHEKCPTKDTSIMVVWKKFVTTLLYKRLNLCVDTNGIYLFGCTNSAFTIQFNWLNSHEKTTLHHFITNRHVFFKDPAKQYFSDHSVLTGFVGNKTSFTRKMRRQILRDFCSLVYQIIPPLRIALSLILLDVGMEKSDKLCILLSKTLIEYTPDGPSMTPIQ